MLPHNSTGMVQRVWEGCVEGREEVGGGHSGVGKGGWKVDLEAEEKDPVMLDPNIASWATRSSLWLLPSPPI